MMNSQLGEGERMGVHFFLYILLYLDVLLYTSGFFSGVVMQVL